MRGRIGELFLDSLVGSWQKDNLAVGRLGHLLHSFEISEGPISHNYQPHYRDVKTYLICIAGALLKISAACLINLADSTSARAAMTLASPVRLA